MKKYFWSLGLLLCLVPSLALAVWPDDPFAKQWAYEHIKVDLAWEKFTGSAEVVVAVIDNGFDSFHPDLRDNLWINTGEIRGNGFDDDNNGYVDDVYGWNFVDKNNNPRPQVENLTKEEKALGTFNHGTLVAGLIGARGNNAWDGVGVNWQVKLMNLKVISNNGVGNLDTLAEAIYYAVDNGAQIINISMVGSGEEFGKEIKKAVKYAYDKGVAVIAAVGNNLNDLNENPLYPACADVGEIEQWVLGVSAINSERRLANFSNIGDSCVDITAPGVGIFSTIRYSPADGLSESYSGGWSGTSFAAPLVSGAAALLKGINPHWQAKDIYQALLSTVHRTPGQDELVYANLFGKGLLQVDKAVEYALQHQSAWLDKEKLLALPNSAWGDVDGNGELDFVKVGGPGEEPVIEIYSADLRLKRKFFAFSHPNQHGLGVMLLDYDSDNKKDILVYAKNSDQPVRIWNYRVKKLKEWPIDLFNKKVAIW